MRRKKVTEMDLIQWQVRLAHRMLNLSSFVRLFSVDSKRHLGRAKQGRERVRRAGVTELISMGYSLSDAKMVVRDAEFFAILLYLEQERLLNTEGEK